MSLKLERKEHELRLLRPSFPIRSQREALPPCIIDDEVVFSKQPNETEAGCKAEYPTLPTERKG